MVGRSYPESLLSPISPVPSVSSLYERSGREPTYRTQSPLAVLRASV